MRWRLGTKARWVIVAAMATVTVTAAFAATAGGDPSTETITNDDAWATSWIQSTSPPRDHAWETTLEIGDPADFEVLPQIYRSIVFTPGTNAGESRLRMWINHTVNGEQVFASVGGVSEDKEAQASFSETTLPLDERGLTRPIRLQRGEIVVRTTAHVWHDIVAPGSGRLDLVIGPMHVKVQHNASSLAVPFLWGIAALAAAFGLAAVFVPKGFR